MKSRGLKVWALALSLLVGGGATYAADVANRRMVWAHYVPWLVPENASQMAQRVYDFPQTDVGENPLRDEIRRALDQGVDGFFNDMVAHEGGQTSFWDLRPYLAAAEGTPFQFGICLDRRISVTNQVKELVRMLSTYGKHPNYATCGDRFVVCTYTYRAWTPDEWRTIRQGCADAGYPIHVIANIETPFSAFDEKVFAPYAGLFEGAFHFSIMGCGRTPFKSVETEMREADAFCRKNGAAFMPCLWPGYYGGWLSGRCSYYQPFLGFDTLQRRFDAAQALDAQWLHLTTWNDHEETTLQTRRLTTGNPAIVRAMARAFRGERPAEKADVVFAYLRENIPGTLLRFEAQRLPSAEKGDISVSGRLIDEQGEIVAGLAERRLTGDDWTRVEWLVPTTELAASHVLTPEFVVRLPSETRIVTLPPVFQFTGWLANPETVKVSVHDRRSIKSAFDLAWKDCILSGSCSFASEAPLKRAVLYRNERPVTAFTPSRRTILPVLFNGGGWLNLRVENGRIAQAVKSFETNGAPNFAWNERGITSLKTPTWMRLTARIETETRTTLTFTDDRAVRTFTPHDLLRFGELRCGAGKIRLSPDGTLYNLPPLGRKDGKLFLSVWSEQPAPTDDFWVEFEFADGTFAESKVQQPFATERRPIPMAIVETPITLEKTSGASGTPDAQVFLTPEAAWPVKTTRLVSAKVSPFAVRRARFDFSGAPLARPKLPHRQWPMGPFRLTCSFTPLATDGAAHPILSPNGWNEGPSLTLAADGCLVATYTGGTGTYASSTGDAAFTYEVKTAAPLTHGRRVRLTLVNDGRTFTLLVDGVKAGSCAIAPVRVYGNCSPSIGDGINGENPTVGLLHDLEFAGDPNAALSPVARQGEDAVPRMSLRLRMENTRTAEQWQKTLAALAANPGCCDEVWFSTGIGLPPMETHRAHVEELKRAAADLLALGITPSLQIQATLGHGDKISALADCSAKAWGGWTGSTGVEDRLCSCPRQPGFLAYMREMAKTYAAFKPGSVWIDDDLRIDNHAPATDGSLNGCWCATCLAAFGAKEGRTWERSALAEAVAKDAAVAARWKAFSVEAIVTVAGVIAEEFHRLSPKTTMAFQHCFNDADIDSVRAVATTLARTSGHPVGLRPGGGSYYDINPCEQIVKSIRAAQFRGRVADLPNVGIWCPEVESCPRAYGSRSAQSILVESFIAMAYGFNSTSLLVTDTRTETEAFVAETILKPLAAAQPVLAGFARANEGTVPAGFSAAGLSPWQIYRYAISGIPVLPGVGRDLGALTKEDLALDVCQVGSATVQRMRDALDARVKGVPATLESPFVGLMVPHVTASGALRTVALLNTRIDAQGPVTLRLRGVPANATLTWRALRCAPLPLTVTRTGDVVRVTIPEIKAWNGGFIDIVESE